MKIVSILKKMRQNPVFFRAGILAASSVLCFICVYLRDNMRKLPKNEKGQIMLERGKAGEERVSELEAEVGELKEDMEIRVSGREWTDRELDEIFRRSGQELEKKMLGENKDPGHVTGPLNLIAELPDTGVHVSWEMDRNDIFDLSGNKKDESLLEQNPDGIPVTLTARLSCGDREETYEFRVKVFPEEKSRREQLVEELKKETEKSDEETGSEKYMLLPDRLGDRQIRWNFKEERRAYAVLIIGIGMSGLLIISEGQRKKEEQKKQIRRMKLDYPQIINKFNLYIRAGMTVRRAWILIAREYENRGKSEGVHRIYEEMAVTARKIQGGMPEGECYEEFGIRCGETSCRKFGMLLSQNLRKGTKGLTELLGREAEEAFEERKKLAKKMGEEAGTKMLIPLFMMLMVVFAIVVIPAFLSIRI